ncbi:hypothetical protein [Sphingomonas gellani]|uniref:hypothetical protein n=1 Tax=Sphingomonas gellani TaxID=1166340 RepID=UPI000B8465F3|nr:hypothetical protein [Sphingomonas gellani]
MQRLRRLATIHRSAAVWLVVLTLAARMLVPGGYMPMPTSEGLRILPCDGWAGASMTMAGMAQDAARADHAGMPGHAMTSPASPAKQPGKADAPTRSEVPCPFAGLAMPSLGGADPVLLVLAIGFIVAAALRIVEHSPRAAAIRPRPPSQAPPHTA